MLAILRIFLHIDGVPPNIQKKIIAKYKELIDIKLEYYKQAAEVE